jgi:hypothetical protein
MPDPLIRFLKDLSALEKMRAKLGRLEHLSPEATPLMLSWMRTIDDDNRRGILAGTDKDGRALYPVQYRPVGRGGRLTSSQKNTAKKGARRGPFVGLGPAAAGLNNNLTTAEYRLLGGPPLAPRKGFSRVITNLKTGWSRIGGGVWQAFGYWDEVVSVKGRRFLHYHFEGAGRLPKRDLRGVRPWGLAKARGAAVAWMRDIVRSVADGR